MLANLTREVNSSQLVEAARKHRMASLLHQQLRGIDGVPRSCLDALATARYEAQTRRIVLLRMLALASEALDALEIPVLTMKGHALAAEWYRDPTIRDFNDLDILVRPQDFERAMTALGSVGMEPATTNWHGFLTHQVAEVPVRFRRWVLDLHWHVVAIGQERRHLRLPTAQFFERAVPVRFGPLEVLTLGPVDTLLHLCVNTGLGGARQLRGLIDIDTVVRSGRVDMNEFAARVRSTGTGRLCAAMLQRSNLVLATPVDPELLVELAADHPWMIMNRLVDRASLQRRSSDNIACGLLLSSGRNSRRATTAAFVDGARRTLSTRVGRHNLTDAGGELDWTRRPEDGNINRHRRDYLDWVATAAVPDDTIQHRPTAKIPQSMALPEVDRG